MTISRTDVDGPPCGLWSRIFSFHLRTWRSMRAAARSIEEYMSSVVSFALISDAVRQRDAEVGDVVKAALDREGGVRRDRILVEVLPDLLELLGRILPHGLRGIHVPKRGRELHGADFPLYPLTLTVVSRCGRAFAPAFTPFPVEGQ